MLLITTTAKAYLLGFLTLASTSPTPGKQDLTEISGFTYCRQSGFAGQCEYFRSAEQGVFGVCRAGYNGYGSLAVAPYGKCMLYDNDKCEGEKAGLIIGGGSANGSSVKDLSGGEGKMGGPWMGFICSASDKYLS